MSTVNFRDVGESLGLWLDPPPVRPGRLFRGGRMDALTRHADIGSPGTILNLRRGPDEHRFSGVRYLHVPASDELENYATETRSVRAWLTRALGALVHPDTIWPVYLHCTSGRDRTGVVVAAALLLLDVPQDIVIEEYLLSQGAERGQIQRAIAGIAAGSGSLEINPDRLRAALAP